MKVRILTLTLMVMAGLFNLYALDSKIGRISYVKGDVYIQRGIDLGFESATVNFPVTEGDRIATSEGRTEIYIGNSNYIRLDRDTKLDVLTLPNRTENTVLRLWTGNIYLSIRKIFNERNIEVQIGDVSLFILQPGTYRVNTSGRNSAELFVVKGAAEVQGNNGNAIIRSNQSIAWEEGELERTRVFYASNFDEFDDFNESRESLIGRARVQRYLPVELYDYEWELTSCGRWHYMSPYGWVWIPPHVFYGWRPYYWGRWAWYPWGWTWVPYEPWGWVTFHFGRWHWHVSFGWYWVPSTVWGPAWVHWTWGDHWIGWCPIDIYNRPVIVINNYWVTHYHNTAPSNSSSFVFIRKDQLMSRDVSKVVLEKERISMLGNVPIYKSQPNLKPASLSPVAESYKGKIMLRNPEPVHFKSGNPDASGTMIKERSRFDSSYDEQGSLKITPKTIKERSPIKNENWENMQESSSVKPRRNLRYNEENIPYREKEEIKSFRFSEEPTTYESFRSIPRERRNQIEPKPYFRENDSLKRSPIENRSQEEMSVYRDSPFSRRSSSSSYNEKNPSSSLRNIFKPFSGSRSSSSSKGSVFKAPSSPPPSHGSSSRSSSGGRAIRKKSD